MICRHGLAYDRKRGKAKAFNEARRAEHAYARSLNRIARHIGSIVNWLYDEDSPNESIARIERAMARYSVTLEDWAWAVGEKMVTDVASRDFKAWKSLGEELGERMGQEIRNAPTGHVMQQLVNEQVTLIKSMPLEAAQRVQRLAMRTLETGERPAGLVEEIMRTGDVTRSRATLIARTEVGRASTAMMQARAQYAGSEGYVWRSSEDARVRPSHEKMDGKFVAWNKPPTLDGLTGHAGALPNCRCFCDPVLKD